MRSIPFNKPFIAGKELHYIAQSIASGKIAGDGQFTAQCARLLESQFGIHRVLMTPSCTAALEMAAILCDFRAGDEDVSAVIHVRIDGQCVRALGAKPVFVDICCDMLNIDEELIEAAITPRHKGDRPGSLRRGRL